MLKSSVIYSLKISIEVEFVKSHKTGIKSEEIKCESESSL